MSRFSKALIAWRDNYDVVDPFQRWDGLHYRGVVLLAHGFEHEPVVQELIEAIDELTNTPSFHTLEHHKEGQDA